MLKLVLEAVGYVRKTDQRTLSWPWAHTNPHEPRRAIRHSNCHVAKKSQGLIFPWWPASQAWHRGQFHEQSSCSIIQTCRKHCVVTVVISPAPPFFSHFLKTLVQFFHACWIKGQDRNTISTDNQVPQGGEQSMRCCKTHLDTSLLGMDVGWNGSRQRWGWRWGNRASRNMIQHPTQEKSPSWAR